MALIAPQDAPSDTAPPARRLASPRSRSGATAGAARDPAPPASLDGLLGGEPEPPTGGRAALAFRLVGAVLLVATLPLAQGVTDGELALFGFLVALAWIPAVGAVHLLRRRADSWPRRCAAMVLDVGLLLGVFVLVEQAGPFLLFAMLLPVGYHAYAGGAVEGLAAALVAVAATLVPPAFGIADVGVDRFSQALYPATVLAVALLASGARAERARVRRSYDRARERADALLAGAAEAVVVTTPRGGVREWNAAAAGMFDCEGAPGVATPASDASRRSCAEVLGLQAGLEELDCSTGCALLRARLRTDDDLQVWRRMPDGERQPLLAHVAPIVDEGGRVVEVVHSFRDITKLVEADEAKTMFLATTTHELKTPLTVITGYAELMLRRPDLSEGERELGLLAVLGRARQLSSIVDRLLMTSRIEAGRIELHPEPVDLAPLVEERVLGMQEATARQVRLAAPDGLPAAHADPAAVATVVDHLLDNALKYSEDGGRVEVELRAGEETVDIEVRDDGIGMSEEDIRRCFERFWQSESGDVRRFGGTGIGLYIVRSLVEGMHGTVDVRSRPGSGTAFSVSLRRAVDADGAGGTDEAGVAAAIGGIGGVGGVGAAAAGGSEQHLERSGRGERTLIDEFVRQVGIGGRGR